MPAPEDVNEARSVSAIMSESSMNRMRFVVFAPPYNAESGGTIALHKLASVLNDLGYEAFMVNLFHNRMVNYRSFIPAIRGLVGSALENMFTGYALNPEFNSRRLRRFPAAFDDSWIVIYPEIVMGNPLNARHVVRWFLHKPGFHEENICYCRHEYHVDYNSFLEGFEYQYPFKCPEKLFVTHFPWETYNMTGAPPLEERTGSAYCIRKGQGRLLAHTTEGSINIDGLSHAETAKILKSVKYFYSYDLYTAYSIFAALCGAVSIIVPEQGVSIGKWFPEEKQRYGVAYGEEQAEWALSTVQLLKESLLQQEHDLNNRVWRFVKNLESFFYGGY